MSTPLLEQIAQAIVGRLENVTIANGYSLNMAAVVRPTRDGQLVTSGGKKYADLSDNFAVLIQGNSTRDTDTLSMGGKSAWKTDFILALFCVPSDKSSEPVDSQTNELVSASMKAIATSGDSSPWGTWGGLAIESWFNDIAIMQPIDGEHAGANLTLQVQYRHPEDNPYILA